MVPLVHAHALDDSSMIYLNRLSDFLFVAARYAAMKEGRTETIWRAHTPQTPPAAAASTTAAAAAPAAATPSDPPK